MKRKLLKVIGISFLIYVVLSWIIPAGTYSSGELTTDGINPAGIFDILNMPIQSFITFILYGVVFATIGGFYGVLEKTGALENVTGGMGRVFKGREKLFLALTIILLAVLSSVTGLLLPLFILVPLFAAVLFAMNFDKITVLASTVGSLLIGSVASTYGFNITGYTANLLGLEMTNQIAAKVILLVILIGGLIFVTLTTNKVAKKKESKEAKMNKEEKEVKEVKEVKKAKTTNASKTTKAGAKKTPAKKTSTKKTSKTTRKKTSTKAMAVAKPVKKVSTSSKKKVSAIPLVVIFSLMLIVCLIGMYNWYYSFGIETFNDLYDTIMAIEIADFPIFEHLLSGVSEFGYWSNIDLVAMMVLASGIIAWIYRLSFNDYIESFIAGVKKWIPTAIYAALASAVLYILYQALYSGSGTIVDTINAKIFGLTDGFNVIVTGIASLISSFFFNDLYYLLADISTFVSSFDTSSLSIAGLLIQSVYGIGMIIFPTSVILVAGLSLFDVSYKEWMKYIWKFALIAFLLVLLVCGILTLL